jgi:hypothetical protein
MPAAALRALARDGRGMDSESPRASPGNVGASESVRGAQTPAAEATAGTRNHKAWPGAQAQRPSGPRKALARLGLARSAETSASTRAPLVALVLFFQCPTRS